MAGALRSQDAAHNVRSARNQNGTAVTRSANVVRQREQHRIIVLNLGRVQRFVENDRKDGPFWDDHFRNAGRQQNRRKTRDQHGTSSKNLE